MAQSLLGLGLPPDCTFCSYLHCCQSSLESADYTECRLTLTSTILLLFPRFLLFLSVSSDFAERALTPLERFLALHFSFFLFAIAICLVLYVRQVSNSLYTYLRTSTRLNRPLRTRCSRRIHAAETPLAIRSLARSRVPPSYPPSYHTTPKPSVLYPSLSSSSRVSLAYGDYGSCVFLFS